MLHINPDKSLVQPLRLKQDADVIIPEDWLTKLGSCVADDVLKLDAGAKSEFIKNLNEKAGPDSTYSLKKCLHESLKVLYVVLTSPETPFDQKTALALKLVDGVANCAPGFHNRVNEAVVSLSIPEDLDELLAVQRQAIVSNAASLAVYELEKAGTLNLATEVHTYNRFFEVACSMGYGVRLLNDNDIYHGQLSVAEIEKKLKATFARQYTVFQILNTLLEQIEQLVKGKGYAGRREEGYAYEDFQKFDDRFLKPYVSMFADQLFESIEDENYVPVVQAIAWRNVKTVLLKKMREEQYFIFTPQEEALLKALASDSDIPPALSPEALSLITTPNECVQALVFFNEWPVKKKANLVSFCFKNKSIAGQKALMEKLEKVPALHAELSQTPALQQLYLSRAIEENNLDKVKALVRQGVDINPVLGILLGKQQSAVLWWLHEDKAIRAAITPQGLQAGIPEGKHYGKMVAEVLVSSRKGCQLLLEDERLQALCPKEIAGRSLKDYLNQAAARQDFKTAGFFAALPHPLVKQFLQHIVYGEQAEAEQLLKNNRDLHHLLLTSEAKVEDYSGRIIKGTALRIALGAEDVHYHENEICMVEMLVPYINSLPNGEEEMAKQIAEQFPDGYEEQERQRIQADEAALRAVVEAIGASENDANCDAALQTFYDYLKPIGVIKTGKHFYTQLLETAFALYDQKYDEFGGWDSRKNNMFWRKVIGHIQRYLPACYAQAFCQGLYDIVEEGTKLSRTLELRNDRGVRFYPLDLNPASRLGFAYAIAGQAFPVS